MRLQAPAPHHRGNAQAACPQLPHESGARDDVTAGVGCCCTSHPEAHRKQEPRARPRSCCRRGIAAPPATVPTTRGSSCNPADTSSSLISVPSRNHPHSRPANLLDVVKAKSDGMWGYRGGCVNSCANVFTIIRRLAAGGGSNWSIPSW